MNDTIKALNEEIQITNTLRILADFKGEGVAVAMLADSLTRLQYQLGQEIVMAKLKSNL